MGTAIGDGRGAQRLKLKVFCDANGGSNAEPCCVVTAASEWMGASAKERGVSNRAPGCSDDERKGNPVPKQ